MVTGCKTLNRPTIRKPNLNRPVPKIIEEFDEHVSESTEGTSSAIAKAKENEVLSIEISKKTEGPTKAMANKITKNSEEQKEDLTKVQENLVGLSKQSSELKQLEAYVQEVDADNKALIAERDAALKELEKKNAELETIAQETGKWYALMWKFVMAGCVAGIAIGVLFMVNGSMKTGMTFTFGSVVMLSISFFLAQHALIVSMVGGALLLGFLVFMLILHWKQKQAISETAHTVEILKETPWSKAKGVIQDMQSPFTRTVIEEVKRKNKQVQIIQKERNRKKVDSIFPFLDDGDERHENDGSIQRVQNSTRRKVRGRNKRTDNRKSERVRGQTPEDIILGTEEGREQDDGFDEILS
jgi:hypothetical protein